MVARSIATKQKYTDQDERKSIIMTFAAATAGPEEG
jgi:hypothetical protein